jgi:hypothetical protein
LPGPLEDPDLLGHAVCHRQARASDREIGGRQTLPGEAGYLAEVRSSVDGDLGRAHHGDPLATRIDGQVADLAELVLVVFHVAAGRVEDDQAAVQADQQKAAVDGKGELPDVHLIDGPDLPITLGHRQDMQSPGAGHHQRGAVWAVGQGGQRSAKLRLDGGIVADHPQVREPGAQGIAPAGG